MAEVAPQPLGGESVEDRVGYLDGHHPRTTCLPPTSTMEATNGGSIPTTGQAGLPQPCADGVAVAQLGALEVSLEIGRANVATCHRTPAERYLRMSPSGISGDRAPVLRCYRCPVPASSQQVRLGDR